MCTIHILCLTESQGVFSSDVQKGHRIFDLVTRKVLYSINVVFNGDEVEMVFLDKKNLFAYF